MAFRYNLAVCSIIENAVGGTVNVQLAAFRLFEVIHFFSITTCIVDFGLSARTDVPADVDNIDSIG